jgi:hypothetical protein
LKKEAISTVGGRTMHTVKAFYYGSKLFGLAPFKLRTQNITREVILDTKLRENVFYSLWSLFLLILMILGGIMQTNVMIKSNTRGEEAVREYSQLFSYMSSITLLNIVNFKRDLAPVVLKQLYKIDGDLLEYEDKVREPKMSQYVFVTKTCILLFPAIMCMALTFVHFENKFEQFYLCLLWTSNLISLIVLIQVLGFMSYLHHKLATLNMAILSVFETRSQILSSDHRKYNHGVSTSVYRDVSRSHNTQNHDISVINTNYSGILLCGTQLNQHSVSSNILSIRNTYNSIFDLLGILGSIYGFPVLVQLTHGFLMLVCDSYTFVRFLHTYQARGPNTIFECSLVALSVVWLLLPFIRLLIITVTCENLSSEIKRLSGSVHKLLLQQDMAADSVHQLQLFSFQLVICKMDFSAAGLFSVKLRYLYSSIAAIVTYFVVLLQLN